MQLVTLPPPRCDLAQRVRMKPLSNRASHGPGPPTSANGQREAELRANRRALLIGRWREERLAVGAHECGDVRDVAPSLLHELRSKPRGPLPLPPPPRVLPSTVRGKKLADARLLLLLAKGGASPPLRNLKNRCGRCNECLRGECGKCDNCLDKPKFGGRGCRKQACSSRRCAYAQELEGAEAKAV